MTFQTHLHWKLSPTSKSKSPKRVIHFSPPSSLLNQEDEIKFRISKKSLSPGFKKLETPLFREREGREKNKVKIRKRIDPAIRNENESNLFILIKNKNEFVSLKY